MRLRHLGGEALRDTVTGTSRPFTLWVIATLVIAGLLLLDSFAVKALSEEANQFRSKGAAITTIVAPSGIDGNACEALSSLPGVRRAGALRKAKLDVVPTLLPLTPLTTYETSPGFSAVLGSNGPSLGVTVPTDVAAAFSLAPGGRIESNTGAVTVGATYSYPADGRRPGFAWTALIPVSDKGVFDECWALVWPSNEDLRQFFVSTVPTLSYSASGARVEVSQLNTHLGTSFLGNERFESRVTRFAPLAAFIALTLLGVLAVRLRRLELASRLHDGMTRAQLSVLMGLEAAAWVAPAALVSAAAGSLTALTINPADSAAVAYTGFAVAGAGLVGGLLGACLASLRIREHHLFAYFKER